MSKQKKLPQTLKELLEIVPSDTKLDYVPLEHPETKEKIYLIGALMMDWWYRKIPGQAGKDGQMWPLCQGIGFHPEMLKLHPDALKEIPTLLNVHSGQKLKRKKAVYVMYHDDGYCRNGERNTRLSKSGDCPVCEIHPDMQSMCMMAHCPDCDVRLLKWKCPKCKVVFDRPQS